MRIPSFIPRPRSALATVAWSSAVLLLLLVGVSAALTPHCQDEGCPTLATLQAYRPPEPPRVYDRRGELLGQLPGPRRVIAPLEEIPPLVREGFIAVEDRRFREHDGVDLWGALRAAVRNVRAGDVEEGASTITMQLVRNVYGTEVLDYNRWRRKLTEARMALAVEERLGKDRILELYLNQIYLGGGVYGVETASRYYFGKSVSGVTPAEAALLVGLAKNPEGYNPRRHPDRAKARRAVVLDVLVQQGLLPEAAAAEARKAEIRLSPDPSAGNTRAWYFAAVDRQVRELWPDPRTRQGLQIHTGLDPDLQRAAHDALVEQIRAVEKGTYGRFLGEPAPGGELPTARRGASPWLQGMAVALDPRTGAIRALVGGRDFGHSEFDRALQARRQPGSAFKPIVLSAALEARTVTLADRMETTPVVVRRAGSAPWSPRDAQSDGEPMTVREALVRSSNNATVRVGQRVGVGPVVRQAREMGLRGPLPEVPSVFLGSGEVTPVELVAAYAAFGNGGRQVVPHLITRVEDRDDSVVWTPDVPSRPVLDPGVAYLVLDVLRDVVDRGTGWRVRQAGWSGPAAGKTGTTDDGRDAWFVGLTPDLAAGVWLGFDEPRAVVAGGGGGSLAAPAWGRMMAAAPEAAGRTDAWTPPADVVEVPVDLGTGYRATDHCPEEAVAPELFLAGTEPVQECPEHRGDFLDRVWRGLKGLIRGG